MSWHDRIFRLVIVLGLTSLFCNIQQPVMAQCEYAAFSRRMTSGAGIADERFGLALATSTINDIIAVSAPGLDRVYLYDVQTSELIHQLTALGLGYGPSLAISSNKLIVGATDLKRAYVFDIPTGELIYTLQPTDGYGNYFGYSVALDGNFAVVSAPFDSENEVEAGAAYMFDVSTAQQLHKFRGSDPYTRLGLAVALGGTQAFVGATHANDDHGAVYQVDVITGQLESTFFDEDPRFPVGGFGRSIAIDGNTLVVGSHQGFWYSTGKVSLFNLMTGQQTHNFVADQYGVGFGRSVAAYGDYVVVGAPWGVKNGFESRVQIFNKTTGQEIANINSFDYETVNEWNQFGNSVAIVGEPPEINGQEKNVPKVIIGSFTNDADAIDAGAIYFFELTKPNPVAADQFTKLRGNFVAGDLKNTFNSDDSYLQIQPGVTLNNSEPPVWVEFSVTAPLGSGDLLCFSIESNTNIPTTQTIELFNWISNQFDVVVPNTDIFNMDTIVVAEPENVADYQNSETGETRARVGWKKSGFALLFPWTVSIDHVNWMISN